MCGNIYVLCGIYGSLEMGIIYVTTTMRYHQTIIGEKSID
jgi:hypothetical protein